MAETSIFWSTGSTGDGASPYTQSQLFQWLRRTHVSDNYASEGPLRGYNSELAVTAGSGQVTVGTGAACIYGIPYENDAALNVSIPTPVSNTRIDRIVLRASWAAQTVRLTRIAGTEGAGEPALTQTANTTWDIPLASVSITTGGVINATDERVFAHFASAVRAENIDANAVGTTAIAAAAVTGSKLGASFGASAKTPLNFVPVAPTTTTLTGTGNRAMAPFTLSGLPTSAVFVLLRVQLIPSASQTNLTFALFMKGDESATLGTVFQAGYGTPPTNETEQAVYGEVTPGATNQLAAQVQIGDGGSWTLNVTLHGYYEPMNV